MFESRLRVGSLSVQLIIAIDLFSYCIIISHNIYYYGSHNTELRSIVRINTSFSRCFFGPAGQER